VTREVLARQMRAMRRGDVDLMDGVFNADAIIDCAAIGGARASWPETAVARHHRRPALHVARPVVRTATGSCTAPRTLDALRIPTVVSRSVRF
jgi:hypothetical protein